MTSHPVVYDPMILKRDTLKNNGAKRRHRHSVTSREPSFLFITSYPPRECGIATYSYDLIKALNNKFRSSFKIRICPVESQTEQHSYGKDIHYALNTDKPGSFAELATTINNSRDICMVLIQHEFGFFAKNAEDLQLFLDSLLKPLVLVFHTVLPRPDDLLKARVQHMADSAKSIIVMTRSSSAILNNDYGVAEEKITVIPHGTHLVPHREKDVLKAKYNLRGRKILSTFGLLSSGKSIETTLDALPEIIKINPDVLFLIIGKTHPSIVKQDGEKYREMLEKKIGQLQLQNHVQFINSFLPLPDLLEYLQLTDIYLFTSKDPNQAVSGTFSYAISCGCPIISTPIPHAVEVLRDDAGVIIDFEDHGQLSAAVNKLLGNDQYRNNISLNGLHRMASTAWENAAIAHAQLFERISEGIVRLKYKLPEISLDHLKKMTTEFGIIQFSQLNHPDLASGYTLDDNARALIAFCQHFELTNDQADLKYILTYFEFIKHCQQSDGRFLNYVTDQRIFAGQNDSDNLEDANGRAIWALGYFISLKRILPRHLISEAEKVLDHSLDNISQIHSTRAMAFAIKGLYYRNSQRIRPLDISLIREMANKLAQMYRHEACENWLWFESYLTYANSVLPEAMLCAWLATDEPLYKEIAQASFDFLLAKTFVEKRIKVISNKDWLHKGVESLETTPGGEQPIDVAYTILALDKFHSAFKNEDYRTKLNIAFDWFLGTNHLNQIIYNPCTGGCYDGLEANYVNLNQGAESTVSYLMARLTIEQYLDTATLPTPSRQKTVIRLHVIDVTCS